MEKLDRWHRSPLYLANIATAAYVNRLNKTRQDGPVQYLSRAGYDNVFTFMVRRDAIREAMRWADKGAQAGAAAIYDKWFRKQAEPLTAEQAQARTAIEEVMVKRAEARKTYGQIALSNTGDDSNRRYAYAYDETGEIVREALILSYEDTEAHTAYVGNGVPVSTSTVFFIDLAPSIVVRNTKNVVLTKVQGRDHSRKELIGGGDDVFSISGKITPMMPGISNAPYRHEYPEQEVNAFINIMKHNGVINILHYVPGNLNVTRCIIQDWSLDKQDNVNEQPYSFTCVGVEPDDALKVMDVLNVVDHAIAQSPEDKWYDMVLDKQFALRGVSILGQASTALGTEIINQSTSLVEELIENVF